MQINTKERMQLKLRIHLYFQRTYVINPANGRKKEYHNRVSPIVRIGGRSNRNPHAKYKTEEDSQSQQSKTISPCRLLAFPCSKEAPKPQQINAAIANSIKCSQLIPYPPFSLLCIDKQTDSSEHHHDNSRP